MDKDAVMSAVRRCYSTWGSRYYDDYYSAESAYPPVHTDIVRELLRQNESRTVLDAGCGPASMLRDLELPGLQRYGFDLTPEMLDEGRRVLAAQGLDASRLWHGSVTEAPDYAGPDDAPANGYDAVICFGVLPHIPEASDDVVLGNLVNATASGGFIACEARNELFSLFTLNRYSRDLFRSTLIREDALAERVANDDERTRLNAALAELDDRFRMDLPPVRKGYEDEPGYDEVLSRTHNPFVLRDLATRLGLVDVEVLFYHYHALPPMLESACPELFRRESVAMEDPTDWRGHFMASAFIVTGQKP